MEFRALLLLLALLGVSLAEPGSGRRGDTDILEWIGTQETLMRSLQDKVTDVEKRRGDVEALAARLNATVDELERQRAEMDSLKRENEALQTRLNASEGEIDKLRQSGGKAAAQIAFSVSLANAGEIYRGPSTDKTLVFKRIFSNTGDAYNQSTGVFTAPVNGLYYFSFSTYGYNTHVMGAILMKNAVRQISTYDYLSEDGEDSSSNAVVLKLAAGDEVSMELWDGGRVFDNLNGHTTFSGFLLFPV